MKKTIYSIIAVSAVLFSSCQNFLDVPSSPSKMTPDLVFENADFADRTVLGIYDCLTADATYSQDLSWVLTSGSDIEVRTYTYPADEARSPSHYTAHSSNSKVTRIWNSLYEAVERANLAVYYIEQSDIYNDANHQYHDFFVELRAEAITLRAMCFMELTRNWGNIPFRTEPAKSDLSNAFTPKSDRMEIYETLVGQLIDCAEGLPWKRSTPERVTQGFARGLAARLALYRAGHDFTTECVWVGPRADASNWHKIAMEQCNLVMSEGGYDLENTFRDYFYKQCQREYSNIETLYEIGFEMGGSSEIGYSVGVRLRKSTQEFGFTSGATICTPPSYFYSFHPEDDRRDISVVYYEYDDLNLRGGGVSRKIYTNSYDFRINKWPLTWAKNDFHTRSYANSAKTGTGINFPIMRYSDILLMYAEASYNYNGSVTAEAKNALWKVRKRAIPGMSMADFDTYLASKDFQQAVEDERMWEFAGEGLRKFDLLRWGKLHTAIQERRVIDDRIINDWTYTFEFPTRADGHARALPDMVYYKWDERNLDYSDINIDYALSVSPGVSYESSDWIWKGLHNGSSSNAANREKASLYWHQANIGIVDVNNAFVAGGRPFQPIPADVIKDYQGRLKQDYGFDF